MKRRMLSDARSTPRWRGRGGSPPSSSDQARPPPPAHGWRSVARDGSYFAAARRRKRASAAPHIVTRRGGGHGNHDAQSIGVPKRRRNGGPRSPPAARGRARRGDDVAASRHCRSGQPRRRGRRRERGATRARARQELECVEPLRSALVRGVGRLLVLASRSYLRGSVSDFLTLFCDGAHEDPRGCAVLEHGSRGSTCATRGPRRSAPRWYHGGVDRRFDANCSSFGSDGRGAAAAAMTVQRHDARGPLHVGDDQPAASGPDPRRRQPRQLFLPRIATRSPRKICGGASFRSSLSFERVCPRTGASTLSPRVGGPPLTRRR